MCAEVEDVISGADLSRQWHTSELFDAMLARGLGFEGRLTKYTLKYAIEGSEVLVYLRRMI